MWYLIEYLNKDAPIRPDQVRTVLVHRVNKGLAWAAVRAQMSGEGWTLVQKSIRVAKEWEVIKLNVPRIS